MGRAGVRPASQLGDGGGSPCPPVAARAAPPLPLQKHEKARRERGGEGLDENFIRLYWEQMLLVGGLQWWRRGRQQPLIAHASWSACATHHTLDCALHPPTPWPPPPPPPSQAVDNIHRERIVHSDLKPANFLVVEGQLKLIDFGIAKAIQSGATRASSSGAAAGGWVGVS